MHFNKNAFTFLKVAPKDGNFVKIMVSRESCSNPILNRLIWQIPIYIYIVLYIYHYQYSSQCSLSSAKTPFLNPTRHTGFDRVRVLVRESCSYVSRPVDCTPIADQFTCHRIRVSSTSAYNVPVTDIWVDDLTIHRACGGVTLSFVS